MKFIEAFGETKPLPHSLRMRSKEELDVQGVWFIQAFGDCSGLGAIVTMMNGVIHGGDCAFLYCGQYEVSRQEVKARLAVMTLSASPFRCLCLLDAFEWEFEGVLQHRDLIIGHVIPIKDRGTKLRIEFRKQAPLPVAAVATSAN